MVRTFALLLALSSVAARVAAADLDIVPEQYRPDPFGGFVASDGTPAAPSRPYDSKHSFPLTTARGAYVSLHLVVRLPQGGSYALAVSAHDPGRKLELDLFREWFHRLAKTGEYYPDALIPVELTHRSSIPEPDNRITGQKAQAYWLDIWTPADAAPGTYRILASLQADNDRSTVAISLRVLDAVVPSDDVVTIDHNSYGSSWIGSFYDVPVPSAESLRLNQLYHRLFYEHRGVFHQLGYGHGGKVIREFAPVLKGSGREKRIDNWDLYDRHYGPLLDGSAMAGTRRGPRPIPYVYLPINPEWPASFLWWGEPGYEVEFVNVVSEMERHFRDKGWTRTRFEMFFNHKKRYKAFPWDGDEVRFSADDEFFVEYRRLLDSAIPEKTPVKFVFRSDSSWTMENQFRKLAGIVNFWVCGGGMFSWYREAADLLKSRGDIVWIYGSAPSVTEVSTAITTNPLRVWLYGIDGWVHWQTVSPGSDPWYSYEGGNTVLAYPGKRFGVNAPIPSLRLKLQRNCVQDLALLESLKATVPLPQLKAEVARRYNGSRPEDWWVPRPALADEPPVEWTNYKIGEAIKAADPQPHNLTVDSWRRVREYVLELAGKGRP